MTRSVAIVPSAISVCSPEEIVDPSLLTLGLVCVYVAATKHYYQQYIYIFLPTAIYQPTFNPGIFHFSAVWSIRSSWSCSSRTSLNPLIRNIGDLNSASKFPRCVVGIGIKSNSYLAQFTCRPLVDPLDQFYSPRFVSVSSDLTPQHRAGSRAVNPLVIQFKSMNSHYWPSKWLTGGYDDIF